ncbi:MAG TPA: asparagine synthetase B [Cytophagales bacterium]|jgi:hypothetical protein|nr:asparagine synthetase B [Cytophagales bacterium]
MKNLFSTLLLSFALVLMAEAQELPGLDKSPMDVAVYKMERTSPPLVKVYYSRPQKNDRKIFGGIVKMEEVWRTGANEATEIKFYQDTEFGGKEVEAGTYSLFTIPDDEKWTIILNSALDQWGAYYYDKEKDVLRVEVDAQETDNTIEAFTIAFDNGQMIMAWDETMVAVPVKP